MVLTTPPGDVLHCDVGITVARLNTDTQHNAYVLKEGETDAPEGLKKALANANGAIFVKSGMVAERAQEQLERFRFDDRRIWPLRRSRFYHAYGKSSAGLFCRSNPR